MISVRRVFDRRVFTGRGRWGFATINFAGGFLNPLLLFLQVEKTTILSFIYNEKSMEERKGAKKDFRTIETGDFWIFINDDETNEKTNEKRA